MDLVTSQDPDYQAFVTGDVDFLLRAAGETVRTYCGWHLAPSITETVANLEIGRGGLILLPSAYVSAVSSVSISSNGVDQVLDPTSYVWNANGYIETADCSGLRSYPYGYGPVFLPVASPGLATVSFTHGYATLPLDIKRLVFELAGWAGSTGAGGDVKTIKSPGFSLSLGNVSLGMNLNPDQKNRLASYRIGAVK